MTMTWKIMLKRRSRWLKCRYLIVTGPFPRDSQSIYHTWLVMSSWSETRLSIIQRKMMLMIPTRTVFRSRMKNIKTRTTILKCWKIKMSPIFFLRLVPTSINLSTDLLEFILGASLIFEDSADQSNILTNKNLNKITWVSLAISFSIAMVSSLDLCSYANLLKGKLQHLIRGKDSVVRPKIIHSLTFNVQAKVSTNLI